MLLNTLAFWAHSQVQKKMNSCEYGLSHIGKSTHLREGIDLEQAEAAFLVVCDPPVNEL